MEEKSKVSGWPELKSIVFQADNRLRSIQLCQRWNVKAYGIASFPRLIASEDCVLNHETNRLGVTQTE